jgi:hypothetical protein
VVQVAVADDEPAVTGCAPQPEIELPPSWKATVPEGLTAPAAPGVTVAVYVTLLFTGGLEFDAARPVVVEPGLTVRVWAELVEFACPDPADAVNAAVSDSGEPPAANDVAHVAVTLDPVPVTG